ncbi:LysR family transcriptional regulator [Desulforhopalus sp. 52FAK]
MLQNLDRLKVFFHVFTLGSVVRAAEILHVSQSAVSQAIQKLEAELNSPLFIRLHKQLIPTSAGKQLHEIVQPFMGALETYVKSLEMAKESPVGELRIGAPYEFGKTYLPSIVADFRQHYKDVTFFLEFGTPDRLLPMLKKGMIDLALVDVFLTKTTTSETHEVYNFKPVLEEEVILACSKEYNDTHIKKDLSFRSLSKQNFIGYRKDQQTIKKWFKHHFAKPNVQVSDVLVVDSHDAVIASIKKGVGLGIIASHLVKHEIQEGEIIPISTSKPAILNPIALVHLQDKIPTLTEKVFAKFMVEQIRIIIPNSGGGMKILDAKF